MGQLFGTHTAPTKSAAGPSRIVQCLLCVAICCVLHGCGLGYVARSGIVQWELLHGRVPIEKVEKTCNLNALERSRLRSVPDIKAFGRTLGLAGSKNYDRVATHWNYTIWNVTSSQPLSFEPKTWWFPIVGTVPYLGFFSYEEAQQLERELLSEGLDVYTRSVGAYSTLGWFEDPVIPWMMSWSEHTLAEVVLHELTHATVWVRGGVAFNESLANFVGKVASMEYLIARFGEDSVHVHVARRSLEDRETWRNVLQHLYQDLNTIYTDPQLTDAQKRARKKTAFASLPARVDAAGFNNSDLYRNIAQHTIWNNARLMGFKTYNNDHEALQVLYEREDHKLGAFLHTVQQILDDSTHDDPSNALRAAVGLPLDEGRE